MTTAWYYDYYEKGAFPHQQELCKAVEWTQQCNLEGRRLVLTTLTHQFSDGTEKEYETTALTDIPVNPLTLRLRTLRKALNQLKEEVNHVNAEIEKTVNDQFDKSKSFGVGITFNAQDSSLETGGAPIEEISFPENKTIRFHYDKVYFALYDFFTNLGSVLDRLAYEINLLYQLGDWLKERLGWFKLIEPTNRFLSCLNVKDKNLAEFIQAQITNFKKIPGYRNRLIHDSTIATNIKTIDFPPKFQVFLPRDSNKPESPMNVDAIEFCEEAKADVLKLLDGSYELMLQYLQSHGKPPW